MYRAIFENFRKLREYENYPLQIAEELGLNMEQFKNDANDPAIDAQIEKEINQMKNSDIPRMAVPKFLIEGKEPQGRSLESFSAIIEQALQNLD